MYIFGKVSKSLFENSYDQYIFHFNFLLIGVFVPPGIKKLNRKKYIVFVLLFIKDNNKSESHTRVITKTICTVIIRRQLESTR